MKSFSLIDFVRDVGKHLTVNYMMAKDSVKKRISGEGTEGMSFTEFTYQLFQGYDFYIFTKKKIAFFKWVVLTSGETLLLEQN